MGQLSHHIEQHEQEAGVRHHNDSSVGALQQHPKNAMHQE